MENNKKNISLIISIFVVIGIIAGGVYYYKYVPKVSVPDENAFVVDSKISANTPKEIFLERNTDLYNAKSFDEMMAVAKKYDNKQRVADNEQLFKEANDSKKEAFFGFAQGLMIPTSSFTKVEEKIDGDTAVVTALDNKGRKSTATFVKENGEWKVSELKILQNPSE